MKTICKNSLISSLGVAAYIILVATFMSHANSWFGSDDKFVTPIVVLLLFSLSALVVGGLLVGKPIFLYIDGKKKDAVQMLFANAGWLLLFFLISLILLALLK